MKATKIEFDVEHSTVKELLDILENMPDNADVKVFVRSWRGSIKKVIITPPQIDAGGEGWGGPDKVDL